MADRSPLALAFAAGCLITVFAWSIAGSGRSPVGPVSGDAKVVLALLRLRESLEAGQRNAAPASPMAAGAAARSEFRAPDGIWAANEPASLHGFYGRTGVWDGEANAQDDSRRP